MTAKAESRTEVLRCPECSRLLVRARLDGEAEIEVVCKKCSARVLYHLEKGGARAPEVLEPGRR